MSAWRKIMDRGVTTFVIAVGLTAASSIALSQDAKAAGAENHEFRYDPEACKTDAQGKVYIAVGRNVFAFSTTGTVIVAQYGNARPTPPDPADEAGCPGNPAQITDYRFPYAFDAPVAKVSSALPQRYPQVDVLTLISIPETAEILVADDIGQPAKSFEAASAPSLCSKDSLPGTSSGIVREELPNGFTACRLKQGSVENQPGSIRATYIARPETYQTPLGKPFVVNCGNATDKTQGERCDVDYVFAPGLGVNYQFQPDHGSRALPIDQVIAYDQGLRAAINATLVKNYRWRD